MQRKKMLNMLRRNICVLMCFLLVYSNTINLNAQKQTNENTEAQIEEVEVEEMEAEEVEAEETEAEEVEVEKMEAEEVEAEETEAEEVEVEEMEAEEVEAEEMEAEEVEVEEMEAEEVEVEEMEAEEVEVEETGAEEVEVEETGAEEVKSKETQAEEVETEEAEEFTHGETVNGITVTVSAEKGVLPKETTVRIMPLSLEEVKELLEEQLSSEGKEIVDAIMFDIALYNSEGNEIQPEGDVQIQFTHIRLDERTERILVYDNTNVIEEMGPSVNAVDFTVNHFSPKGIIAISNKTEEKAEEAETEEAEEFTHNETVNGITVTVSAEKGVLPKETTVRIMPLSLEEVKELLEEQLSSEGKEIVDAIMFDITLYNSEGNEIQPEGDVQIQFTNIRLDEKAESALVYDNTNLIKEVSPSVNTVEYTVNHFSPKGIIAVSSYDNEEEPITYIVRFDANGGIGDLPQAEQGKANTVITMPEQGNLTNGNKVFVGWSLVNNANGINMYSPGRGGTIYKPTSTEFTIPEEDVIMYATWSDLDVTADFYIRLDGLIPTEPQNHPNGEYVGPIHMNNAIKVGTFYTNSSDGVNHMLNCIPTDEQIKNVYPTYNPEVEYVIWYVIKHENPSWHVDGVLVNKDKVNLTYDPNAPAGTWSNMPDGKQYYAGDTVTVSNKIPERKGYTFVNWNTKADNIGKSYTGNDTFIISEDTTLYAQWRPNSATKYVVEYYLQKEDGEYPETPDKKVEKYAATNATVYSDTQALSFDGYEYDEANVNNIKSGIVNGDGTLTLKRYYNKMKSVNLTYDPNAPEGTWSNMPDGKQYYAGDIVTVSSKIPERKGYTFVNWNTKVDNIGKSYTGNDTFIISEDTTLYAQWRPNSATKYVVEYYLQKEDGEYPETPDKKVEKYAATNATVYSDTQALNFDGYEYDEANGNNIKSGIVNGEGTLTLKRYYNKMKRVNLTYDPNAPEGTWSNMPDGKQYYVGDTVTVSSKIPERKGYTFVNWNTKADNIGKSYTGNDTFIISEDTTLYAQWRPNSATKYVVEYYLQKEDGEYPETPDKKVEKYAATNATVYSDTQALSFDGYKYDEANVNNIKSGIVNGEGTLTLKRYYYKTCNIGGVKIWNDGNNQDAIRPSSIVVWLFVDDGKIIDSVNVTAEDNWKFLFKNLPKYSNGKEITYVIGEQIVNGYEAEFDGFNIINTHKPKEYEQVIGVEEPTEEKELNSNGLSYEGYVEVVVPVSDNSNETKVIQIPFTGDTNNSNALPIAGVILLASLIAIIMLQRKK